MVHDLLDRTKAELIEVRNQADQLIYAAEKALTDLGEKVDAAKRSQIEDQVRQLRKQLEENADAATLRRTIEELSKASQELAAQAYAQLGRYDEALTVVHNYETEWKNRGLYAFSNALVYTLAGQDIAAVVEVDQALGIGLAPGLFSLPWFDTLCTNTRFVALLAAAGDNTRCPPAGIPPA